MSAKPNHVVTRTNCIACRKLFAVPPSALERGGGKTCSMACRWSLVGFQRVTDELPGTVKDIALRSGAQASVIRANLKKMLGMGMCHIEGFELQADADGKGFPSYAAIFATGPATDPDMPQELQKALTYYMRKVILGAMPGIVSEISRKTHLHGTSVLRIAKGMQKEKLCHIGGWTRAVRGKPVQVFHAGPGTNLPCKIKKMSKIEVQRRYRKKLMKDPDLADKRDARLAAERARYWEQKARDRGDPLTNALHGR